MEPQATFAIRSAAYWRCTPAVGPAERLLAGALGVLLLSIALLATPLPSVSGGVIGSSATFTAAALTEMPGAKPDAAPRTDATFSGAGCEATDCCC
jgi:hypothetical protein